MIFLDLDFFSVLFGTCYLLFGILFLFYLVLVIYI